MEMKHLVPAEKKNGASFVTVQQDLPVLIIQGVSFSGMAD
jgi:hypothetical protein